MNKFLSKICLGASLLILLVNSPLSAQDLVKPTIASPWAAEVDPQQPHQEYPRPQMSRENWLNLNGQWDYAIVAKDAGRPQNWDGKITVPFPVESLLSGVGKAVGEKNRLWYIKSVQLPPNYRKGKLLLHFGAVDWETEVFVNGQSVGKHQGGYDPFSFDISKFVKGNTLELVLSVWDPSDLGPQPRGKQVNKPHGIWYTPVTGIWQTVWLEPVGTAHITSIRNTPDFDNNTIAVLAEVAGAGQNHSVKVSISSDGQAVGEKTVKPGEKAEIRINNPTAWTPESPHLYDVEVILLEGRKQSDKVKSYAALRKISMQADNNGIQRMMLNNKFLFQYGPLDQGWWPDGLYTAPSDAALKYDVEKTKEMGFNMIRKHVKVEPARWYYHCDQIGLLVWQDMPNGDHGNNWEQRPGIIGKGTDRDRTAESEAIFRKEWKAIMDATYNFPSIVVYVPFNEAWGQFKTKEITDWTQKHDPTRLVNSASGGNFEMTGTKITGDMIDFHNYPDAVMPDPQIYGKDQIVVLGEFGGLGLPVANHTWQDKDNWGYQSFKTPDELQNRYASLIVALEKLIPLGLSAAVYTQTTDVEVEVNGLMTYDRKVIKMPASRLKEMHQKLYQAKINL
jgi:beta-galactosidase/beta-glucuronidase